MANNKIKGLTVEIGGDTTQLGKALEDVNKKSRDLSSELGEVNKLLKMDPGNADLLAQKQKILAEAVENTAEELKTLKEAEKQVQKQFERGEVSEEQVRALQREIIATEKKMSNYEAAVRETAEAVENLGKESDDAEDELKDTKKGADKASDSLDDMADSADKAGDASEGLGSKLGGLVAGGLKALAAGVTAVVGAMAASAEASREYRTEMGKLDTAFTTAGHSSEAAKETYKSLQGVLGETDQAVEAATHLAKLTDNEQDLQKWTDICTGVYATFGASLPIEGLTEAANETAKTGALTGSLADALNWAGVNEEAFQMQLDACTTEQERQALITETLNGLYSEAAEKYKETSAEVIRANQANEEWMASTAEIGGVVEPLLTDIKLLGASLLSDLVPGVKEVAGAFRGMLNGDEGAAANLGEALSGIFSQLLTKITDMLPAVANTALNLVSTLITTIITALPNFLSTGVEVVVAIIEGIASAIPQIVQVISEIIPGLVSALVEGIPQIIDGAVQLLLAILDAIPQILPPLVAAIPQIVITVIDALLSAIPQLIDGAVQFLTAIIDAIPIMIQSLIPEIPRIIKTIISGILSATPQLLDAAITLLFALIDAIPEICAALIREAPAIISTLLGVLASLPSKLWSLLSQAIEKVLQFGANAAAKAKEGATKIFNAVVDGIKNLPSKMLSIGTDLVKGLWNGISDMTSWVINKIKGFGESVLSGIKNFFGIKSPSRVFKNEIGKMLSVGLAEGIEDNADQPLKAMANLSNDLLGEADAMNGLTLERRVQHAFSAPETATAAETGILGKLDKILQAIEQGQVITINGDTLVGATVNSMNSALGQRRVLAERGAV